MRPTLNSNLRAIAYIPHRDLVTTHPVTTRAATQLLVPIFLLIQIAHLVIALPTTQNGR